MQKTDLVLRGLRRKIKLAEGDAPSAPTEVELIRCGTFHHPQYGKFEITPEILLSFKKNFDDGVRGVDLAIDYKHASEDIAAGWFKALTLKENGTSLWVIPEWTPNGARVLSDKEFRYISADFQMDYKDNESLKSYGPTLMGAGLTNRPVVKKMEAVVELSEGKGSDIMQKELDELKAKCADLQKENDALKAAQVAKPAAPAPEAELGAKPPVDPNADKLKQENKELSEKIKTMETTSKFDKMLSEGRVVEAQRAPFIAGDMVKFSELSVPTNPKAIGSGGEPTVEVEAKTSEEAQSQILTLAEPKIKAGMRRADAISSVLSEKPELAKKAYG